MKTKLIIAALATLVLLGCGSSKEATVSAETPVYWTEVARQNAEKGDPIITFADKDGHVIVVAYGYQCIAVTQIK